MGKILVVQMAMGLVFLAAACSGSTAPASTGAVAANPAGVGADAQGDANAGKQLIMAKGCGNCHTVPGVPEAKGTMATLSGFASKPTIAGTAPNNQENLEKWLKNPSAVKPSSQMPSLGLSDKDIKDLAAFLNTLK